MGRTWRREERQYNKNKVKKGQTWDRNKRTIKEDEVITKDRKSDDTSKRH